VVEVPASFLVLMVVLLLIWSGHVGMARHVRHSGPLYAHVAQGLGPVPAVGAAGVVLLSYNAIQCCLYGLFGATMNQYGLGPWWMWALIAWALIAIFGLGQITVTARVLAGLLAVELLVVLAFVIFGLATHPGGALDTGAVMPNHLLAGGLFSKGSQVGSVLALAVACFVGVETTLAFGEEAVGYKILSRASFGSLIFLGVLYTLAAWAVVAVIGPGNVAKADPSVVYTVLGDHFGLLGKVLAEIFLATSIFAAMLSFHQTVARYTFTMSREQLLPAQLRSVGARTGAPIGGSLVQSAVALIVIMVCGFVNIDPMNMFFWLSALAAVGIMSLLAVNAWSAWVYFARRRRGPSTIATRLRILPALGAIGMAGVVVVTVSNLDALTGAAPGSWQVYIVPGLVGIVAIAGLVWGAVVYVSRRDIASGIGRGETEPLAVLEHHLLPHGSRL
jgi:amino acid transporter